MSDQREERPKVGTGVYLVNNQNELFLLCRQNAHGAGTWCAMGGHLEFGESFEECARREVKEEAGIDVGEIDIVGLTNNIFEAEGKHYVTIGLKVRSYQGEPRLMEPEKFSEVGWFPLDRLPDNLFVSFRNFLASDPVCLCGSGSRWTKCHGKN